MSSAPLKVFHAAGFAFLSRRSALRWSEAFKAESKTPRTSVLLPEPEIPLTTVSLLIGKRT